MADLKTLCIDLECMDIPQGGLYTAGDNIDLANDIISLITSPAFKGAPTAPTNGNASDGSTQVATNQFVQNAINRRLPKSIIYASIASFSCPNNANQTRNLWTAPSAGTLIATLLINFAANASNARNAILTTNQGGMYADTKVSACSSGVTKISVTGVVRVSAGTVLQAVIFQNSGTSLTVTGGTVGYFIPD